MEWLDQRLARAMAEPQTARRRDVSRLRTLGPALLVVAASLVLAGAVAAAMGLFERTIAPIPGWTAAWERAEIVDLSEIDAGLTLTLERAYVDVNQVIVFVSVEGLASPRASDDVVIDHLDWNGTLREPTGRYPIAATGMAAVDADLGVAVMSMEFDPPVSAAGTYELEVTSIRYGADGPECVSPCSSDEIEGSWRFTFDLPEPIGTVVTLDVADTVGSATLRLTELRITPTMISARIAMFVDDRPVAYWGFIPGPDDLSHGDMTYGFWTGRHILDVEPYTEGPVMAYSTTAGSDEAAGTWEIVIPSVDYGMGDGEAVHVDGPWTLSVTVP